MSTPAHPRSRSITSLPAPDPQLNPVLTLDSRDLPRTPMVENRQPPKGAPNVLVILLDDVGFGSPSTFGGPCAMPTADRLAAQGLRYSRFHVTAMCSPTRQSLLTGRNHHAVGMGCITDHATSAPGYTSIRPQSAATLAQVLNLNGYNTAAFGKWHQTPEWEIGPAGPFDRWPTGEGFEKFYGFIGGEMNHWTPHLYDGTTPIQPNSSGAYHLTEDLVDHAIAWMQLQRLTFPDKPFFIYLPLGACHAPLHVGKEWIDKYRGKFSQGWDEQRELTFQTQKSIGLIPEDAVLPPWPDDVPHWNELSSNQRAVSERLMETYAGFAEHADAQVGRLIDAIDDAGVLENTLTAYILGDNGGSGEGGLYGAMNTELTYHGVTENADDMVHRLDEIGGPTSLPLQPVGWTLAMNTPYRWTKSVASHFGGTRNGMVIHWPSGIESGGELRHQWHHVNDIYATVLDVAGIAVPDYVNGIQQQRLDGTSMAYSFNEAQAPDHRTSQYFEMVGNRGIYHEGWMAVAKHRAPWEPLSEDGPFEDDPWELYDLGTDWTQSRDLAGEHPHKLRELQDVFLMEAARNYVLPLDHRYEERSNRELAGRLDVFEGRTSIVLRDGMTRFREGSAPDFKNRSFAITAEVEITDGRAEGVLIHQGGRFAGWTMYCDDGHLVYGYNYFGLEEFSVCSATSLNAGPHSLRVEFVYDGGGVGRGGDVTLMVDGLRVGTGRVERTVPYFFSWHETLDVGVDLGTPVVDYPWSDTAFKSTLLSVRVDLGRTPPPTEEERNGRAYHTASSH